MEQPNYRGNEVDCQNYTSLNQWYQDKLYLLNISSNSSESQDLKKKMCSREWTKFQQEQLNKAFIALCQTVEEKVNTNKKEGKKSAHKNLLLSYFQSLRWHSLNRRTAAIWRCVETGDHCKTFLFKWKSDKHFTEHTSGLWWKGRRRQGNILAISVKVVAD